MKIVYFDYWTKGISNFIEVDKKLKYQGHKTLLLHVGSFNSPHPENEIIHNIDVFDITYFKTKFIYTALKKINPDVVLSLNTTYIIDRCLVLSCRKLQITSVFMMHGQRSVGKDLENALRLAKRPKFKQYLGRAMKYFLIVIPNYTYAVLKNKFSNILRFNWVKVLFLYTKNPALSNRFPPSPDEIIFDKCLIYSKQYIEYYSKIGYSLEVMKVVGDPKNERLFRFLEGTINIEHCEKVVNLINKNSDYAVYIEDGFVEQQFGKWNYEYLSNHILELYRRLKNDNIELVVKLHPVTDKRIFNTPAFKEIIILQNESPEPLIKNAVFCVANASSLVSMALLMYKPILSPAWIDSFQRLPKLYIESNVASVWEKITDPIIKSVSKNRIDNLLDETVTIRSLGAVDNIVSEILK